MLDKIIALLEPMTKRERDRIVRTLAAFYFRLDDLEEE